MDNDKLLGLAYLVGILIVWQLGRRILWLAQSALARARARTRPVDESHDFVAGPGIPYVPPPVISIHASVDLTRPPGCCPLCGRTWPLPGPAAEVNVWPPAPASAFDGIQEGLVDRLDHPHKHLGPQGPGDPVQPVQQPPSPPDPGSRHQK